VYEETLTGRPHDTSVQIAASDRHENVDAYLRHAQNEIPDKAVTRTHILAHTIVGG